MKKNIAVLFRSYHNEQEFEPIYQLKEKINTVIVILLDEGHQFIGSFNTIYDFLLRKNVGNDVTQFIFIGNYTQEYSFKQRGVDVHLVPFLHGPFDMYNPGRQISFLKVVEPDITTKTSKVSFMYYGWRSERDVIFCELYKRNLLENVAYHSDRKNSNEPNLIYGKESDFIKLGYNEFNIYEKIKHLLPKKIDNHITYSDNYYPRTINLVKSSLFNIVSESNLSEEFNNTNVNICTEKSATPFFAKSIPVFITRNSISSIKWFEQLGFDCFTDIIPPEIYELSFTEKIQRILDIIELTDISFFEKNIDRFNKNYDVAYKLIYNRNTIYKTIDDIIEKHNIRITLEARSNGSCILFPS